MSVGSSKLLGFDDDSYQSAYDAGAFAFSVFNLSQVGNFTSAYLDSSQWASVNIMALCNTQNVVLFCDFYNNSTGVHYFGGQLNSVNHLITTWLSWNIPVAGPWTRFRAQVADVVNPYQLYYGALFHNRAHPINTQSGGMGTFSAQNFTITHGVELTLAQKNYFGGECAMAAFGGTQGFTVQLQVWDAPQAWVTVFAHTFAANVWDTVRYISPAGAQQLLVDDTSATTDCTGANLFCVNSPQGT